MDLRYRRAIHHDLEAIAALHADSWRRTYRGMYSDAYLDGDLVADRRTVWEERLLDGDPRRVLLVAETDGAFAGFVCAYGAADETWGSLIDNLHVARAYQRLGLGRALMHSAASELNERHAESPVHLWALEGNTNARTFYEALGGRNESVAPHERPGGGMIQVCRYVWERPASLIAACRP
ncbi:MAG: GNAT family N-acetyltransferase [Dehalococcoidia bacterium]